MFNCLQYLRTWTEESFTFFIPANGLFSCSQSWIQPLIQLLLIEFQLPVIPLPLISYQRRISPYNIPWYRFTMYFTLRQTLDCDFLPMILNCRGEILELTWNEKTEKIFNIIGIITLFHEQSNYCLEIPFKTHCGNHFRRWISRNPNYIVISNHK